MIDLLFLNRKNYGTATKDSSNFIVFSFIFNKLIFQDNLRH